MGLLLGAIWLTPGRVCAETAPESERAQASARTQVLLTLIGAGVESVRGSLVALLEGQLERMSLSLVEQQSSGSLSDWAAGVGQSKQALLAIALDTTHKRAWRLVVLDVGRGRAIARDLPGGIERDAASVEAVESIVISAASALREGLEVASAPVEAVLGDAPERSSPTPIKQPLSQPEHRPSPHRVIVRGAVGATIASFSSAATSSPGAAFALGVGWRGRLEARAFGSLFWPVPVRSGWGEFRVNRSLVGAAAGPVFSMRSFSILPEVGVVLERLRRSDTLPTEGVIASEARPLYRAGGLVALRLRYALFRPLSLELVLGGAYLGRSVQFSVRSGEGHPLMEAGPVMGFAQLGFDLATE